MSALTEPRPRGGTGAGFGGLDVGGYRTVTGPTRPVDHKRRNARIESAAIFTLTTAVLFALGYWVTIDLHVVFHDGESRLAHAFMAVWDRPAKLASIGFVWPPLQTMALLPFILIKPLATTLVALPLFSAVCGGIMLTVLNRTLTMFEIGWKWRYALLLVFGASPLFLCYASNGMAEILYLMLLTLGLHYFVGWYLSGATSYRRLAVSGTFMAFGFLARYELAAWIGVMTIFIILFKWREGQRRWADLEAPLLTFLAPAIYVVVIWAAISMQVVGGGPMSWFTRANDQEQGPAIIHPHVISLAGDVLVLTGRISPLLWVVPIGLIILAVVRRDLFTGWLAVLVLLGALVTFVLVADRPHTGLLQPRYNIRSFPAVIIGAGWLLRETKPGLGRKAVGTLFIVSMLAAIPLAFVMEEHYPYQFEEKAWANAIRTGQDQTYNKKVGGYTIGIRSDQQLARWINAHIHRDKAVLVDDGAFPGVILLSGRPKLFLSRVDHGDKYWSSVLASPWGGVRYMIAANPAQPNAGVSPDKIQAFSRNAYSGGFPGTHVVYHTVLAAVVEIDRREPLGLLLIQTRKASFRPHGPIRRLTRTPPASS